MRIVGGDLRGRKLAALGKGDPAAHLRPTSDRMRESVFNILHSRFGGVEDRVVLDVFAGTGALGLEALSRGAARARFLENGRKSAGLIAQNIDTLGVAARADLMTRDATRPGPAPEPHDLVFLDPPYGKGLGEKALLALRDAGWVAPEAVIVWEEASPKAAPEGFTLIDTRPMGGSALTFLKA
ncbi:16S rRNA (guanine(966)-N(2))-methyltransferase RsmD [Paracoccaceae bacterium GXU_MW_L88]